LSNFAVGSFGFILGFGPGRTGTFRLLYFLRDFDSKFERGGCLKSRDARLSSGGRAFNKRNELLLQRLLAFNRNFVARDFSCLAPVDLAALFFVIERKVCVLLEDADFSH